MPPDYSNGASWIFRSETRDKPVDLFFMHPTTYFDTADGMNADLKNDAVNAASNSVAKHQTGVFVDSCNLFAPRYRQASISVLGLEEELKDRHLKVGLGDMKSAFLYYMAHYNQGRPVILAGHSQGSNLSLWFLLDGSFPMEKLLAAYLIGWSVTENDLERLGLPLAGTPDQTGCIITWNTISQGGKSPVIKEGALGVNPLSWTVDTRFVPEDKNLGAVIQMPDSAIKRIPLFTGARIDPSLGGLVIPVPSIDSLLNHGMGPGVYHGYDYDFFYENLRENVRLRCLAWFEK